MIPLFMHCEWRKILFINFRIDPRILQPLLPKHTELELYQHECLITVAAFDFLNIRMMGLPIPAHQHIQEVNLRFYITHKNNQRIKRRGVMFINEIVPRHFFKNIANLLFCEKYVVHPTRSHISSDKTLSVSYGVKLKDNWNILGAMASPMPELIRERTLEEFIAEHYYGYNHWYSGTTIELRLHHPRWMAYRVESFQVDFRFGDFYPRQYLPFLYEEPHSVQLIEGSPVFMYPNRIL